MSCCRCQYIGRVSVAALFLGHVTGVLEGLLMIENLLSFTNCFGKEDGRFDWVLANTCLMREEESICAIENGN